MKRTFILAVTVCLLAACGENKNEKTQTNNNAKQEAMNTISNKEKAVALLKAIETGASEPIGYVNAENYKQHNLTIADGLDGIGAALAGLVNYPEKAKVNTLFSAIFG